MKLLMVGQLPPPQHGSNVMAEITLGALRNKGYEVIFIDKLFSKSIETVGKASVRKILRVPILAFEVLIACLSRKPALCIYFIASGIIPVLVDTFIIFFIRLCGVPYILDLHGKGFRNNLQNANLIWRKIVSYTLYKALGGIVLCEALKHDVNLVIPDELLFSMPNAIQNRQISFRRVTEEQMVAKNYEKDYVQVLFLSNLIPSKGPLEVLKAVKIVIQKRKDVRFVLAGVDRDENFSKQLKAYINDNGLDEFVKMPGGVYGEDKENLFASSDIFVFPTYYHAETFGIVNIEAMRAGLPVISSSEGAIPEVVQDGVTGFIINPHSPEEIAEKILLLVNNPDLRKEMGMRGRKVFESNYTLEAYGENLDKCIKFFLEKIKVS